MKKQSKLVLYALKKKHWRVCPINDHNNNILGSYYFNNYQMLLDFIEARNKSLYWKTKPVEYTDAHKRDFVLITYDILLCYYEREPEIFSEFMKKWETNLKY